MEKFPHVQLPLSIQELLMTGEITKEELICWLAIKSFDWTNQGKGKGCTASQSTIAKVMNVSRKNANPHIQSLVEKGLVQKIDNGKGKTNTYICLIPEPKGIHPVLGGVPQTGQVGVPQTGQVGVPQTGQVGVPQTGHKEYEPNNKKEKNIKPTKPEENDTYKKHPLYGEYEYLKGALGWLVSNDESVFKLYKKHAVQTGRVTMDIMELWGRYCDNLEREGITDFNSHIGQFFGKDIYTMKTEKEQKAAEQGKVRSRKSKARVYELPQSIEETEQQQNSSDDEVVEINAVKEKLKLMEERLRKKKTGVL